GGLGPRGARRRLPLVHRNLRRQPPAHRRRVLPGAGPDGAGVAALSLPRPRPAAALPAPRLAGGRGGRAVPRGPPGVGGALGRVLGAPRRAGLRVPRRRHAWAISLRSTYFWILPDGVRGMDSRISSRSGQNCLAIPAASRCWVSSRSVGGAPSGTTTAQPR